MFSKMFKKWTLELHGWHACVLHLFYYWPVNKCFIADRLPNMTFCGPARDTVLTNRQTEKLNFDTNYITTKFTRLAALLCILRRKRHPSFQRKKLYLRMSSVLLNTSIIAIYCLWKSSEIVLLTNRSQYVLLLRNHSRYVCPCTVRFSVRNCTHGCQIYY
jgi:hypothetical protein